jgi:hypothetical protein
MKPGELVVTEVMANPPGNDAGKEYFEAYNSSNRDLDLSGLGLAFVDADGVEQPTFLVVAGRVAANEYVVFGGVLPEAAPDYVEIAYSDAFALKNRGGTIALTCGGEEIDSARYPATTGSGVAVGLDGSLKPDAKANDDAANFCPAVSEFRPGFYGTPGKRNDKCQPPTTDDYCRDGTELRPAMHPRRGDLVVSEVMADPKASPDPAGEWVEILATTSFDLNGVSVGRTTGSGIKTAPIHSLECLTLQAGELAVLAHNQDPTQNGGLPTVRALFGVALKNGAGDLFFAFRDERLDEVSWPSAAPGASRVLDPNHLNPSANDVPQNWSICAACFGAGDHGTPGLPNEGCSSTLATHPSCDK